MSIKLRGSVYYIDIRHPATGKRIRVSTDTSNREDAQQLHDKLKYELWAQEKLGVPVSRTFAEAAVKWVTENAHKKSIDDDRDRLGWLTARIGALPLHKVTRTVIENLIETKKGEVWQGRPISNATVNRVLSALSVVLHAAQAWGWIEEVPVIRRLKETKRPELYYTRDQIVTMVSLLPLVKAEIFCFAIVTGQRVGNIVGLRWANVDLDNCCFWVTSDEFKSGSAHNVPLNTEAMAILAQRWGEGEEPESEYVFTNRDGKKICRLSDVSWYNALRVAGLKGKMRFHDTRHTWASFHTMAGTSPMVLQQLGGWKDRRMVDRYSHLAPNFAAQFAGNVKIK